MATITGFLYDNEGLWIPKDPEASLTYSLDWQDWLSNGETISSSTFTVETITGDSDPLIKVSQSSSDTVATVKISGGTSGNIYRVYDEVVTSGGLTERRYFRIKVEQRSL